ncbi:CYFA0S10e00892g1_1 [Cyberlindnera fabianii]|uniref:Chorismate mutase n=1 Tax=Cyberlindnera fabianii TaxID=36022 RepID=A0A061AYP6_CYBFA|nr:Chorismate mutase [Cyberlindnera fabianii]CDR42666.1 CYFA0S10e00892g1_1 [Cyberlindnera fabianii]
MDFLKPESVLDLQNIRDALVRMEDTIIFNFIERSQFCTCPSVYERNKFNIPNFDGSFLDWSHVELEKVHSQVRRFESPDEVPFFPDQLKEPLLPSINYPKILASYADEVNINSLIKEVYLEHIVPLISAGEGEQPENLGSCTVCDIDNLQALSRRIHFGKFVAEAKYQNEKELFTELIKKKDVAGIDAAITNSAVEAKILERLVTKAQVYGTDPTLKLAENQQGKVNAEYLAKIYKDWVIPLTKKVEVDYLLRRLEDEPEQS